MRSLFKIFLLGLSSSPVYSDASLPGDKREPRCEKRSNTDPGRLNIESAANQYGLTKPCESSLDFYIARNTSMRSASGLITVFAENGKLHDHSFRINFDEAGSGLFSDKYKIPSQRNHTCQELEVNLASLECRDKEDKRMECPVVRLKTSMVFKDLMVNSKAINVCYDN